MSKSCLTNLISVYDKVIGFVGGREQWMLYYDLAKSFGTVFHYSHVSKLKKSSLDKDNKRWMCNC